MNRKKKKHEQMRGMKGIPPGLGLDALTDGSNKETRNVYFSATEHYFSLTTIQPYKSAAAVISSVEQECFTSHE